VYELLSERTARLLLKDRDDWFDAGELVGVEVDDVSAWGERRVFERLEIRAHVLEDRFNGKHILNW